MEKRAKVGFSPFTHMAGCLKAKLEDLTDGTIEKIAPDRILIFPPRKYLYGTSFQKKK